MPPNCRLVSCKARTTETVTGISETLKDHMEQLSNGVQVDGGEVLHWAVLSSIPTELHKETSAHWGYNYKAPYTGGLINNVMSQHQWHRSGTWNSRMQSWIVGD